MNSQTSVARDKFFYTDNLKLAAALVTAGFALRTEVRNGETVIVGIDRVMVGGREILTFELEPTHNGIKAIWFLGAFDNKFDLSERVNQIIAERGITPEEQAILAFDGARTGLHNGSNMLYAGKNQMPVEAKQIAGGRMLVYRVGTPKAHLKKLVENA